MLEIRTAEKNEYEIVRIFYHSLIRAMRDSEFLPGWEVDIYPSPEFLRDSIHNGELYIGVVDGQIAASMVVNHEFNESYNSFQWPTEAEKYEITVIHALGVHPVYAGRGIAKKWFKKQFLLPEIISRR